MMVMMMMMMVMMMVIMATKIKAFSSWEHHITTWKWSDIQLKLYFNPRLWSWNNRNYTETQGNKKIFLWCSASPIRSME
jgi:hypothetical protein